MGEPDCFQDAMPGNLCFGCGADNPEGLRIRSYWEGDEAVCRWAPERRHQGWAGLTCGGIIATLIDCHCMATAMAAALRAEGRPLGSLPEYRFATGTLTVRYLRPTPIDEPLELRARVTGTDGRRRTTLACALYTNGERCVEADVIAFLVYRSDRPQLSKPGFGHGT